MTLHEETDWHYRGWKVTAACFALAAFAWGCCFYGQTVYLFEFSVRRGWSISLVSAATTAFYLCTAYCMTLVSGLVARFGAKCAVLLAVGSLAFGLFLLGQVQAPWQLFVVYPFIAFGWASMGVVMISTVLSKWFDERRGLAIGLAFNGASLGGMLIAPGMVALSAAYGFTAATSVVIAALAVLLVPIVILWVGSPESVTNAARKPELSAKRLLSQTRFWDIAAPFAVALVGQVGFLMHQLAVLEPSLGRNGASLALAAVTGAGIVGRIAVGTTVHRHDPRVYAALAMFCHTASLTTFAFATNPIALFVACIVFGFSLANLVMLPSLVVQRVFESAEFARAIGLVSAVGVVM
ncbi:MAG: MFS transporter, partial [Burkholderiales bacterium]